MVPEFRPQDSFLAHFQWNQLFERPPAPCEGLTNHFRCIQHRALSTRSQLSVMCLSSLRAAAQPFTPSTRREWKFIYGIYAHKTGSWCRVIYLRQSNVFTLQEKNRLKYFVSFPINISIPNLLRHQKINASYFCASIITQSVQSGGQWPPDIDVRGELLQLRG